MDNSEIFNFGRKCQAYYSDAKLLQSKQGSGNAGVVVDYLTISIIFAKKAGVEVPDIEEYLKEWEIIKKERDAKHDILSQFKKESKQ